MAVSLTLGIHVVFGRRIFAEKMVKDRKNSMLIEKTPKWGYCRIFRHPIFATRIQKET